MNAPCYKCKNRKKYCHSNCQRYLEYKKEIEKINKKKDIENG